MNKFAQEIMKMYDKSNLHQPLERSNHSKKNSLLHPHFIIKNEKVDHVVKFTYREMEVALHLIEGLSYNFIGKKLSMSVRTVESHIYRMRKKLDCNRHEFIDILLKAPSVIDFKKQYPDISKNINQF